jgi:hypothetical protein
LRLTELNQYRYFFLESIHTDENVVTIYLKVGKEGDPEDLTLNGVTLRGTKPVIEDEDLQIEVVFPSFIAYNVLWESFSVWSDYDIFEGRNIREYSKSRYMEYVRDDTIATDEWPGKLRHFGFCCEWHVIDIISIDEPKIRMIKGIRDNKDKTSLRVYVR